jgi:hypothetical protein
MNPMMNIVDCRTDPSCNSDVSDGWEREQENETYFNQYSERVAYPLGINIIFYLMTH